MAALGSPGLLFGLAAAGGFLVAVISGLLSLVGLSFWAWFVTICSVAAVGALAAYLKAYLKFVVGLPGVPVWQTVHLTHLKMKFYDNHPNPAVPYAKHALSIDENRADFKRVPWDKMGANNDKKHFEQVWFSGNHSDVGGSYPENESRLSDIALQWMVEAARSVPDGILVDENILRLYPSPAGSQHDECKSGRFGRFWKKQLRKVPPGAPLHSSVLERFEQAHVLHYDVVKPYRPENLSDHPAVARYYGAPSSYDRGDRLP